MKEECDEVIKNMKNWYNVAALKHQYAIDTNRDTMPIFQLFVDKLLKAKVVELGCGNGIPIGKALLELDIDYVGVDLSETQIELAKKELPKHSESFRVGEMIEFLTSLSANSLGGIVSQFAIFHVPRYLHCYLFELIKQKLKPGAPVLFTCHPSSWEGYESAFFDSPMFWSNFSNEWYSITLKELGFEFISSFRHQVIFNDKPEIQYFMLYCKPNRVENE